MSSTVTTIMSDSQDTMMNNPQDSLKEVPPKIITEDEIKVRSGVTGAVIGFLLGGPILSALVGFAAAYASQKKGTKGGDYARSLGDFGVSIRAKALAFDEKHRIGERSSKVASDAWVTAKKYDTKCNILDKTKDTAVTYWLRFVSLVRERHLLERGVEVTGKGYEYVADKIGANGDSKKED